MSEKGKSRAHTMSEEILDGAGKSGGERPETPETPVSGASKASTPPRPVSKVPAPKRSRVTKPD